MKFIFVLLLLFNSSKSWSSEVPFEATFTQLPSVILSGAKIENFNSLKDKVVLVDFWASWCEPCKAALPNYEALYHKYKSKGLVIIGINVDDDLKGRDEFLKKNKLSFPLYADLSKKMTNDFHVQAVPTLFVFDKGLKPITFYRGFSDKKLKALEQKMEELLK